MRKTVLGIVAAGVALPALAAPASAQGYYQPNYGYGGYSQYDRNGDGYISEREARRAERQAYRQQQRYNNYYGNSYGYAGSGYNQYSNGYYDGPTWRGNDGRYYCRRSDGTTGLIVGGGAGALIGSQVAGRGDRTLGAIIGGAIGAVVGREVERGSDRRSCR